MDKINDDVNVYLMSSKFKHYAMESVRINSHILPHRVPEVDTNMIKALQMKFLELEANSRCLWLNSWSQFFNCRCIRVLVLASSGFRIAPSL